MRKINLFMTVSFIIFLAISCNKNRNVETEIDGSKASDSISTINDELEFKKIHLCTELLPPPPPNLGIKYKSDTSFYYRKKNKNDILTQNTFKPNKAYIAMLKQYRWAENHRDITVKFLDGDQITQNRVIEVAKEWEKHCGIRFIFGNFQNADITISFLYEGSWSYIGTYSRRMTPSMNFGWLYNDSPQEEFDRVVLHEFGHALGFIHEHQSPTGNIKWNIEKVYDYYMRSPNKWDKPTVDINIFEKYKHDQVNATKFDPKSIMLYAIPKELTKDGYSTSENSQLSELDKSAVATIYPQR